MSDTRYVYRIIDASPTRGGYSSTTGYIVQDWIGYYHSEEEAHKRAATVMGDTDRPYKVEVREQIPYWLR